MSMFGNHRETGGADIVARGFGWRHATRKKATLADVNFTIRAGEKVLLLGESGAGKSTLLAGIAGVLGSADDGDYAGSLTVGGEDPRVRRGVVGLVLQDPDSQVISARVGDDVVFGCENLAVDRDEMWRRASEALELVKLDVPLWHPTAKLSGGQKQRLAIAGVLAMGARVIALDEPTANLDPVGVLEVRDSVVRAATHTGATLIVVEHRVDVWADVVDRVLVIGSDGQIVADGPVDTVMAAHGQRLADDGVWIPGRDPELPASRPVRCPTSLPPATSPAVVAGGHAGLAIGDSSSGGRAVSPDLQSRGLLTGWDGDTVVGSARDVVLPAGASTVITGANGAGKTTLALTLAGLLPPLSGEVVAAPRLADGTTSTHPHDWSSRQLASRIGFVFQDPEHQFVARTVREELLIGPTVMGGRGKLGWFGAIKARLLPEDTARVDELLERLRLSHLAETNPFTLSGGQKRRLSVATALVTSPKVVIFDEPTFGQDRRTFTEMVLLLRELADSGVTLASITHDHLFVSALGDWRLEVTP